MSRKEAGIYNFYIGMGMPTAKSESRHSPFDGYLITPQMISESFKTNDGVIDYNFLLTQSKVTINRVRPSEDAEALSNRIVFGRLSNTEHARKVGIIGELGRLKGQAWIGGNCAYLTSPSEPLAVTLWSLLQTPECQGMFLKDLKSNRPNPFFYSIDRQNSMIAINKFFDNSKDLASLDRELNKINKKLRLVNDQRLNLLAARTKLIKSFL